MKRRVLAILCVLSILMGMVVMPATAATTDSTEASTYNVGYAKVDLNPFIKTDATKAAVGDLGIEPNDAYVDADPYVGQITIQTSETETATVDFVKTPLSGYGDVSTRLADRMTDDNGDGIVGLGDGIFGTATSVTDSLGNTVIYITMDFLNGNATLSKAVRAAVVAELGVDTIAENRIMISGSHSHEAPEYSNLYNAWYAHDRKGEQFSARGAYWQYLIDQLTNAAVTAYNNATPATMSKGSIEAPTAMAAMNYKYSDGTGYKLNFVRNYKAIKTVTTRTYTRGFLSSSWSLESTDVSTSEWYFGDNFGTAVTAKDEPTPSYSGTSPGVYTKTTTETDIVVEHATEGNQTMNLLQFTPTNGGKPIVMVEWRAHASINGHSYFTNISSDYVNALRYRLENNATLFRGETNYCVGFWQGAAGNNNNTSDIASEYAYNTDDPYTDNSKDTIIYTGYPSITLNDMGNGNDVKVPLEIDAHNAGSGFYYDYYRSFGTEAGSYSDEFYRSVLYGYILGKVAIYGLNNSMTQVTDYGEIRCIQNNYAAERQIWSEDYFLAAFEAIITKGYKSTSTPYTATNGVVLNSYYHANAILGDYTYSYDANTKELNAGYAPKTTPVTMELNAILMGSQVALVTSTGELYDYYDINKATTAAENDWLELTSQELLGNDSYGTPFTLSYTNNSTGYAPNTLAYDFPTNAEGTAFGSYEANTTDFAVGTGEKIIDQYAAMLTREKSLCAVCNKEVDWSDLASNALSTHTVLVSGHYRLTGDTDTPAAGTNNYFTANGTICLDLNGYTFNSRGRSIILDGINDEVTTGKSILNLMDTSDNKTGAVVAHPASNNVAGGVVNASDGAILNLYGGTLKLSGEEGNVTNKGGIISAAGSSTYINLYGGCVDGATCTLAEDTGNYIGDGDGCGAAIALNAAHLYVSGDAKITKGTALTLGDGVYVERASSVVTLADNAQVDDIYFAYAPASKLVLESTFAGTAGLTFADSIALNQNIDIGNVESGAVVSGVICTNQKANGTYWQVRTSGTNLVLYGYDDSTQAVIVNGSEETEYTSLANAISAYTSNGSNYIKLIKAPTDTAVTVSKETYLDLNGCSVSANITANAPLYVMDSMTDDYNVNDSYGYGKLTNANNTGTIEGVPVDSEVAKDGYLKVTETAGVSFHRVNLQIYATNIRAQSTDGTSYDPGMYYSIKEGFSADSVVANLINSSDKNYYGIAMLADDGDSSNGKEIPSAATLEDDNHSKYSSFKAGNAQNTANGTLLRGILKESNNVLINRRNANITVYGSAYIKIGDQYMFGSCVEQSLRNLFVGTTVVIGGVEKAQTPINNRAFLDTLNDTQWECLLGLYEKYQSMIDAWITESGETNHFQAILNDAEYNALKILVVGNSHGLDATNLLYEVFEDQKQNGKYVTADGREYSEVVIGNLYHASYNMNQHAAAANNTANYSYNKISTGDPTGTKWQLDIENYDDSMYYGLQDEEWDIVVMQTMNHRSGINDNTDDSYSFNQANYKAVADYIMKNCKNGVQPKLAWHMVWTNPDDAQFFDSTDTTQALYTHPSYRDGSNTAWVDNHNDWYGTDGRYVQSSMYDAIVNAMQTKILSDNYFGYDIDYVLPSAVAVQYAQDVLGCTDAQMYRDWTHINNYGRLMVAYTWWAELMGYDSIGVDIIGEIPGNLDHGQSGKNENLSKNDAGNFVVTDDLKRIITRSVNYALDMNDPSLDNAYEIVGDNTISILGIGNSYTMDCMHLLGEVYEAENRDKTVEIGFAYYAGCNLAQHVDFINNKSADYIYYELDTSTGTWKTTSNMTLQNIIAKKNWEMVSMQQSSARSGDASTYNSNIQTIQSTVESVLGYKPTYLWNMTWAYPVNDIDGDAFTTVNTTDAFKSLYGNNQATMYKKIVETVQAKIVPDATFEYLMPVGTAIQNANATLDDPDLYRDYTHLNDFARVIAAYVWYSELETVTLDEIKLTVIPEALTYSYGKAGGTGDMTLTPEQISLITECVKDARTNNFETTDTSVYAN